MENDQLHKRSLFLHSKKVNTELQCANITNNLSCPNLSWKVVQCNFWYKDEGHVGFWIKSRKMYDLLVEYIRTFNSTNVNIQDYIKNN